MAYRPPYISFCVYSVTETERALCSNQQLPAAERASNIPCASHGCSAKVLHNIKPGIRLGLADPRNTCNPDECSVTPCRRAPRPNQPYASICLCFVPVEPRID